MSHPSVTRLSAEHSARSTRAELLRARLFEVDVKRPKRIDHQIDYFGSGNAPPADVDADPRGNPTFDTAFCRFLSIIKSGDRRRERDRRLTDGRRSTGSPGRWTSRAWGARTARADP